jgi:hypothetical protein
MTIFGKPLSEYAAFCGIFLILVPLTGIVRLALSLSGTPNNTVRWISMTAVMWIAVVYCAVRVHTTRFGSYRHLLVPYVLLNLTTQLVSILGIVISMVSGTPNIFSAPEFSFGTSNGVHLAAHLTIGPIAGSLVPWLFGSLILLITRKLAPPPSRVEV